jgi:hypothetical protein
MMTHADSAPHRTGGSLHPNTSTVDQILSISWDRQLAKDLAAEIEACTGERRDTVEEMRRFLALKGYRELLQRLRSAREGKTSEEALKAVAHAFRSYALERPALSAAAFRTATDCPEWREAHDDLHAFMLDVFGRLRPAARSGGGRTEHAAMPGSRPRSERNDAHADRRLFL